MPVLVINSFELLEDMLQLNLVASKLFKHHFEDLNWNTLGND